VRWRLAEATGTSRGHTEEDHTLGRSGGVGAWWMDLYSTPHKCSRLGTRMTTPTRGRKGQACGGGDCSSVAAAAVREDG
jgi:hypothetical protein